MDDFRQLRHFVEVARQGSFTSAAEKLGLSVPALSKSIAVLEKKLKVSVFIRTTRSLRLSGHGQQLFERLSPLFDGIEATVRQVDSETQEPHGLVTVSTVTAFGKHCILPLLPEFFARNPGIELALSFHDGARGLSRGHFDIRINWGERREQGKVAQVLSIMPLALVGSPSYLAKHGEPQRPEDLVRHECIGTALANNVKSHWKFTPIDARKHSAAKKFEFIPKGRLVVMDELDAVVDAARLGLGLTVMSADCILEELRNGSLVRLLPNYLIAGNNADQSKIIIQYASRKHLPHKVVVLVRFLLEKLQGKNPLNAITNIRS